MQVRRIASAASIFLTFSCVLALGTGCSLMAPPPVVEVGPAVDGALTKAHEAARPLLINTTSKWCVPCKAFVRDAETCPTLKQAVSVFERITIDSTEHEVDCYVLHIECFPTFIILSPGGGLLARWHGYKPPPQDMAERLVLELYHAGRAYEMRGQSQQAYELYRLAAEAGQSGPVADSARKAAAELVDFAKASPHKRAEWPIAHRLADRSGD
ncbi:MAG: thioredoxin family protein [Phycisphaerae bacterium]|nr:thioredoxin family protein [Phycisphaerae bacterium]